MVCPPKFANILFVSMFEDIFAKGSADYDGVGLDIAVEVNDTGFGYAGALNGSDFGTVLDPMGNFGEV